MLTIIEKEQQCQIDHDQAATARNRAVLEAARKSRSHHSSTIRLALIFHFTMALTAAGLYQSGRGNYAPVFLIIYLASFAAMPFY